MGENEVVVVMVSVAVAGVMLGRICSAESIQTARKTLKGIKAILISLRGKFCLASARRDKPHLGQALRSVLTLAEHFGQVTVAIAISLNIYYK